MMPPPAMRPVAAADSATDQRMMPPPAMRPVAAADRATDQRMMPPPAMRPVAAAADGATDQRMMPPPAMRPVAAGNPPATSTLQIHPPAAAADLTPADGSQKISPRPQAIESVLPSGWQIVPSKSRPGSVSYLHAATGWKQSHFPDSSLTTDQIVEHARKRKGGTSKVSRATKMAKPLLKNQNTSNWRDFLTAGTSNSKKKKKKKKNGDL